MCGRYASARKRIELLEEFAVERDRVTEPLEPDYNVAPTKPVYAVLTRRPRRSEAGDGSATAGDGGQAGDAGHDEGGTTGGEARELRVVRWGLVPFWAKDKAIGSRMINARAETVDVKPAFRSAFARRRCLLPADGYYEWYRSGTDAKAAKQPYYIRRADGGPLAFAGLYELWRDRAVPDDHPDAWLWTATIITTSAPDELGRIHERMPMVISPDKWADWLDPGNNDTGDVRGLLVPAASGELTSYPVSTTVNSVRNNGPRLIEPAEPEPGSAAPAGPGSPAEPPARARRLPSAASRGTPGNGPGTLF
jgi:putative SOS response-associated peptidase YedK